MDSAQGSDLAKNFGDLSHNKNFSEIKPPLHNYSDLRVLLILFPIPFLLKIAVVIDRRFKTKCFQKLLT